MGVEDHARADGGEQACEDRSSADEQEDGGQQADEDFGDGQEVDPFEGVIVGVDPDQVGAEGHHRSDQHDSRRERRRRSAVPDTDHRLRRPPVSRLRAGRWTGCERVGHGRTTPSCGTEVRS
ncbi:hypothetical protein IU500_04445 [Nocardia terpenica]|uniref:hypothetical protein n=1 Tax=Nocardia terpenica TaxID=455432 RepID=UPI001893FEA3|nr:hypothetical protein [Nocardia terpenica]MBF6059170.1 hypothetical protein [Nocardia terpenica]MBF6103291.1 hypothetical protein [Nocardia terpenica]MBF6110520.1 hypothetical protein [Nocardia terpenica]MBF6116651.1 hypothetical protein [Nocardia terpenica]